MPHQPATAEAGPGRLLHPGRQPAQRPHAHKGLHAQGIEELWGDLHPALGVDRVPNGATELVAGVQHKGVGAPGRCLHLGRLDRRGLPCGAAKASGLLAAAALRSEQRVCGHIPARGGHLVRAGWCMASGACVGRHGAENPIICLAWLSFRWMIVMSAAD